MNEGEVLRIVITSSVVAAAVSLVGSLLTLFKTQERQDQRDVLADQRKLRDAQRERLRASCLLLMEQAWAMRRFMVRHGSVSGSGSQGESHPRDKFTAAWQQIEDTKDRVNATISVDTDNEAIIAANLAYIRHYDQFVAAIMSGWTRPLGESGKWEGIAGEKRDAAKAALVTLVATIQAELVPLAQPIAPARRPPPAPGQDDWLIDMENPDPAAPR